MKFNEDVVIKILALALDNSTPDHRLEYLLKKLYGKDNLSLDQPNDILHSRIVDIVDSLR